MVSNNIRVYQSNDILYEINRKKKKNMQCQDVKNIVNAVFLFPRFCWRYSFHSCIRDVSSSFMSCG